MRDAVHGMSSDAWRGVKQSSGQNMVQCEWIIEALVHCAGKVGNNRTNLSFGDSRSGWC